MDDSKKLRELIVGFLNSSLKPKEELLLEELIGQVAAAYGRLHGCSKCAGKARLFRALHDLRYAFESFETSCYA